MTMSLSSSPAPPPSLQMRLTNAIHCTVKSILDFHRSRLEHPSQGGDHIIASLLPLKNKVKSLGGGGNIPHSPT